MQVALRIEWLGEPERFEQLGPDWERMLPADARPFDTHTWYRSWYRAFGAEGEMRICLAWEGERLVAAMPLMERRRRWLSAMANVHSNVYRPVGRDAAAVRSVVEAVLARGGGKVSMSALPSDDISLPMMVEIATRAGRRHVVGAEHTSPIVELDGDFADWRARSKPGWGAPLERFRRKMTREHDASFVIVEAPTRPGLRAGPRLSPSRPAAGRRQRHRDHLRPADRDLLPRDRLELRRARRAAALPGGAGRPLGRLRPLPAAPRAPAPAQDRATTSASAASPPAW